MDNVEFKVVINGVAIFYASESEAVRMAKFAGYPLSKIRISGANSANGQSMQSSGPGNATGSAPSGKSGYIF